MFHTILVPLDGSRSGEVVLPIVARLARESGATVHIVHVHVPFDPTPIHIEGLPVIDDDLHSLAAEHERTYLDRVRNRLSDECVRVVAARLEGPIAPAIAAYATDISADLIALTTHGHSGFARFWLGNVADALVRCAQIPLLLIRPHEREKAPPPPYKRILVPLDGSELAEAILPTIETIAALERSTIVLLRIVEPVNLPEGMLLDSRGWPIGADINDRIAEARAYLDQVAKRLHTAEMTVEIEVVSETSAANAILHSAKNHAVQLIALATHGRSGLERTLVGSVADKVVRGSEIPVLVLRPK